MNMRSDLLKKLFQAYADSDDKNFIEVATEIIQEEERKNHNLLAKDLKKLIHSKQQQKFNLNPISRRYKTNIPVPRDIDKGFPLLSIKEYYFNFDDLVLSSETNEGLKLIIDEFKTRDILNSYGIKPKQKILFSGPPGTGKTLSAKVLSSVLCYPLVHIRFDSIISSYLGETATNLRKIFDFIEEGEWVVLFDEFDIVGKKRDDPYEHGEIKRVVNNFMQMLDDYEGKSLIIAITNHQHLLDTAIWRRFDDILYFDLPDNERREKLFVKYLKVLKRSKDIKYDKLGNMTEDFSPADISQVCEESFRRIIVSNQKEVTENDLIWAINQQKRKKEIIMKV